MSNELTVAVIGCRGVGWLHINAWSLQSGVRIAALCDSDGHTAATAAVRYSGAAAFADFRALLSSQTFDVVDICLDLPVRAQAAAAAIRAGANVVCETPVALTAEETRTITAAAAERERLFMPVYPHRFHPPVLFARELLENDDLGMPVSFRCRFSDGRSFLETSATGEDAAGPGVLRETAQHGIDLFRALLGEAEAAGGLTTCVTPGLAVEDGGVVVLRARAGALGVVEAFQKLPGSRNVVEIYGTVGACLLDYDAGTVRYRTVDHSIWQTHDVSGLNGLEGALAHFSDALRGLQRLAVNGDDAVRALEIIEGLGLDRP